MKKKKDTVNSHGQMGDAIKGNGKMESRTVKEFTEISKEWSVQDYGPMVRR